MSNEIRIINGIFLILQNEEKFATFVIEWKNCSEVSKAAKIIDAKDGSDAWRR